MKRLSDWPEVSQVASGGAGSAPGGLALPTVREPQLQPPRAMPPSPVPPSARPRWEESWCSGRCSKLASWDVQLHSAEQELRRRETSS